MNCTPMVPHPLDNFVNERVLAFGKQAAPGSILGVGQDRRHRDATAARSPPRKIRPRASIPLGRPNPMQVVGAGDRKYPESRFFSAELNIVDARCRAKNAYQFVCQVKSRRNESAVTAIGIIRAARPRPNRDTKASGSRGTARFLFPPST